MLKLVNVKFDNIKQNFNSIYKNGISHIPFEDYKLFDNLKVKDTNILSGSFILNDIAANEENLFDPYVLDINSSSICVCAVFILNKDNKKAFVSSLANKLSLLKDYNIRNRDEEMFKINALFSSLIDESLAYVLVDFNKDINENKKDLIESCLENYSSNIPFIVLDEEIKPVYEDDKNFEEISVTDLTSIEEIKQSIEEKKPSKIKKQKTKIDLSQVKPTIKKIFKENVLFLLFSALFAAFSTFGCYFFPNGFALNKTSISVILMIDTILFFILLLYLNISTFNTYIKRKFNELFKGLLTTFFSLFNLVGVGLAFLLSYIFSSNNLIINISEMNFNLIIPSIILGVVIIIEPIFVYFGFKLFKK